MQIRPLEDLTKDELIALIQRERERYEAVGAGGVSLMGDAKDAEIARLRETLQFYADGDHFIRHDDSAWDTVSGEPQNLYEDESNTATVEDGTFARAALTQQEQV